VQFYDGSTWKTLAPSVAAGDYVATSQSTTSGTYTDLATGGPTVTLTTGTTVIVAVSSQQANSSGNANADTGHCYHSFAVTGASSFVAADNYSAQGGQIFANQINGRSGVFYVSGLTAGSNVFTSKYKVGVAGTATFAGRHIAVWAL
jgi:hypothetical protein